MSDKPAATSDEYFAIPGWSAISLRGADASRFAHAQFMGDVAALAPGHWQWNGWLTPKGRLIALFALLKLDDDALLLLPADVDPEGLAAALSRFVFRSKVAITVENGLHVTGRLSAPTSASGPALAGSDPATGIELDFGGEGGARTLRISAQPSPDDPVPAQRWHAFDLAHGLPRLPASQQKQWTPQQLSLDRLKAYSVKKGCYPGQEIVTRTHFLGKAKRGLMRLRGTGTVEPGEVMAGLLPGAGTIDMTRPIGQIICAVANEGLAVMPLDAGDGPFHGGDQPLERLALLDGLSR